MTATILDFTTSVVNALSAFGAVQNLSPVYKAEDIQAMEVVVIAGPETWVKQARSSATLVTYDVIVLVQGRIDVNSMDLAAYTDQVEQIKLTVLRALKPPEIIQPSPYDQVKLYEDAIFTTQVTIRFKGFVQ
jgi:hypothetical protein